MTSTETRTAALRCRHRADGSWGNRATRKRRSHQEKGVPSDVTPCATQAARFTEPPAALKANSLSGAFRRVGCCDDQREPVIAVIPGFLTLEGEAEAFRCAL